MSAPWIADRDERIAALTRAGYSRRHIAAEVGVTTRTVERARVRMGVARPFCGNPLSADELRLAENLLDDGASYGEVARTLRRSLWTIRNRFPGRSTWKVGSGREFRDFRARLDAI